MLENRDSKYVIGIDIGGTYFRIGALDVGKQLRNFKVESTNILNKNDEQLNNLKNYIEDYTERYGDGKLLAICIGFPSAVSKCKKVVYQSPNISGFNDINVGDLLSSDFSVPVYVDNDVNNLLIYEIIERKLEDAGTVIGIFFGTGLGNAIYMNNEIIEGKHGIAGELGHIPVFGKFDQCGCGNTGCMEMYASGKKLEELKSKYFMDTNIKDVFKYHRNDPVIQDFIGALSIPISVEMNIFDPDHIIIGGGVVNMDCFPKEELERYVFMHARKPYPADDFKISYATGSKESGVLGAAYNAYQRIGFSE
jgi:Transcriptional regulator/sugar kinase